MEQTLYLGEFDSTTPGASVPVGHLDTHLAQIIVREGTAATGTIAVEQQADADGEQSGWFNCFEYQTSGGGSIATLASVDVSANVSKFLFGQYQNIRINPNISAGDVKVWLVAKRKR